MHKFRIGITKRIRQILITSGILMMGLQTVSFGAIDMGLLHNNNSLVELTDDAGSPLTASIKESRTAAEILYDYGIIEGYNGDLMIEQALTRAEACVLLAELNGQKSEAATRVYTPYFSDVNTGAWYASYVTYAKELGWISGYPDGTFKPSQAISGQEWASMMLTLMGYPFTWETVSYEIEALGINFKDNQYDAFYRGEAFELLWQVLNTPAFDDVVKMGTKLGYFAETKANSAEVSGYITPSLRMVKLKFNNPIIVNVDDLNTSFSVRKSDGTDIAVTYGSYDEDYKELTLIFEKSLLTYDVISVEISNILAEDQTILDNIIVEGISIIDIVNPTVTRGLLISDQEFAIIFSEPILAFGSKSIETEEGIYITSVEMTSGNTVALVSFDHDPDVLPTSVKLLNTITDDYGHSLLAQNVTLVTN